MNVGGVTVVSKDGNIQYHLFNYHKSRTDNIIHTYIYIYICLYTTLLNYFMSLYTHDITFSAFNNKVISETQGFFQKGVSVPRSKASKASKAPHGICSKCFTSCRNFDLGDRAGVVLLVELVEKLLRLMWSRPLVLKIDLLIYVYLMYNMCKYIYIFVYILKYYIKYIVNHMK